MFLGVGVLTTVGGVFHLFTHAFFKALLFLTAGSVMHAMAGQLDLRKLSGLRHKMPVTCWLMFVGCLALAGFPLTAGFFSKDLILATAIEKGLSDSTAHTLILWMGILGIVTAFLTAFYTFRLWFRVFMGPEFYEMGEEHHGDEDEHGHEEHDEHGHHEPHEMPWWPMNAPLAVLAVGAVFAGWFGIFGGESHGWIGEMIRRHQRRGRCRARRGSRGPWQRGSAWRQSSPRRPSHDVRLALAARGDATAQRAAGHRRHRAGGVFPLAEPPRGGQGGQRRPADRDALCQ
jgi:NADH:ubiquinone oxidoreductase subunit 5 (subunit L)/multisubunit Na+/H+ antiporter MnhA subunit